MTKRPGIFGNEDRFAIRRITNQNNAAEGTGLPPRLIGGVRVPPVSSLRVVRVEQVTTGQTRFTLIWNTPTIDNVSRYTVYVTGTPIENLVSAGPFLTAHPPAIFTITVSADCFLTFTVQTVLNNGLIASPDIAPTCTGKATL